SQASTRKRMSPLLREWPSRRCRARSEIEGGADLGALAHLGADFEASLLQVRAFAHGYQSEGAAPVEPALDRLDVHTDAVVSDQGGDGPCLEHDHHLDGGGARVLAGIVQCLLDDAEERWLQRSRQPRCRADHPPMPRPPRPIAELLDEFAQRGDEPEVVERHRPQVEDQPPRLVEDVPDTILQLVELLGDELRVTRDETLQYLGLQNEVCP